MPAAKEMTVCCGCGTWVPDLPGKPHPYIGQRWLLVREYGEYGYPQPAHRLTVDTYAVQHPDQPGPWAIRSVGAHLASLCLLLEHGLSADLATKWMRFLWLPKP